MWQDRRHSGVYSCDPFNPDNSRLPVTLRDPEASSYTTSTRCLPESSARCACHPALHQRNHQQNVAVKARRFAAWGSKEPHPGNHAVQASEQGVLHTGVAVQNRGEGLLENEDNPLGPAQEGKHTHSWHHELAVANSRERRIAHRVVIAAGLAMVGKQRRTQAWGQMSTGQGWVEHKEKRPTCTSGNTPAHPHLVGATRIPVCHRLDGHAHDYPGQVNGNYWKGHLMGGSRARLKDCTKAQKAN